MDRALGHRVGVEAEEHAAVVGRDRVPVGQHRLAALVVRAAPVPDAEQRDGAQAGAHERIALLGALGDPELNLGIGQLSARARRHVQRHAAIRDRFVLDRPRAGGVDARDIWARLVVDDLAVGAMDGHDDRGDVLLIGREAEARELGALRGREVAARGGYIAGDGRAGEELAVVVKQRARRHRFTSRQRSTSRASAPKVRRDFGFGASASRGAAGGGSPGGSSDDDGPARVERVRR